MEINTSIANRAPETAAVLKTIPSNILRWGIAAMGILVILVVFASVQWIHFETNEKVGAVAKNEQILQLNIAEMDYASINAITIGTQQLEKEEDFEISTISGQSQIQLKVPAVIPNNDSKEFVVEIHQTQSLMAIIMEDIIG